MRSYGTFTKKSDSELLPAAGVLWRRWLWLRFRRKSFLYYSSVTVFLGVASYLNEPSAPSAFGVGLLLAAALVTWGLRGEVAAARHARQLLKNVRVSPGMIMAVRWWGRARQRVTYSFEVDGFSYSCEEEFVRGHLAGMGGSIWVIHNAENPLAPCRLVMDGYTPE